MPVQAPQWTDFLSCPICTQTFDETIRKPISLGCGHTVCKMCLNKLHRKACPFDQTTINTDIELLPVNSALLQLVGAQCVGRWIVVVECSSVIAQEQPFNLVLSLSQQSELFRSLEKPKGPLNIEENITHITIAFYLIGKFLDEDLKVAGKYKGNDYSQYSPWSCDTIGSYIGTKDAKPKDVVAAGSVEMMAWFRKMNKRLVPRRPLSASLGQLNEVGLPSAAVLPDEGAVDLPSRKTPALPNGIVSAGNTVTQLIPRGTDATYDSSLKPGKIDHLSSSAPGSPPDLLESVPKSISALPVNPHPVPPRGPTDLPPMPVTKPLQMVPRGSQLYPAQQADVYYQDPRGAAPPFEPAPYQQDRQRRAFVVFLSSQRLTQQLFRTKISLFCIINQDLGFLVQNVESKGMRDQRLDLQRRAAETSDDDLIPFGDRPTVSRFGAISRTSKTIYQGGGPMQAMAPQGAPTKPINISDYSPYGTHGGWGGSPYSPHQNIPSQGHFSERERLSISEVASHGKPLPSAEREQLRLELQQLNHQISQQTQLRGLEAVSNRLVLQREVNTLAGQSQPPPPPPKWPGMISSEQLSLELHQVEREIGKRTRELSMENQCSLDMKSKLNTSKQAENGQPEPQNKVPAEDLTLTFSDVPNGSALTQENISLLSNKTSSLNLSEDPEGGGDNNDSQRAGVTPTSAP
ncbi:roquin-1 [Leptonychotes weddellii]|uniref:Roquin-1 n=1 Tax=Leptonychotes weddellii TaxID=9713 RepID=A0A2U3XU18_LEPWE|nr:roquin-1 [Leptonychotes weddellii]